MLVVAAVGAGVAVAEGGSSPDIGVHPKGPGAISARGQETEPGEAAPPANPGASGGGPAPVFDLTPGRLCLAALAAATGTTLAQIASDPANLAACGFTTAQAAPSAPTGPSAAALAAWEHDVVLPAPTLRVQPGWAIVGQLAYLELGGTRTVHWSGVALGVPVDIDATGTYDVDWGDGTVATGLPGPGGSWPTGNITHAYQRAGTYTISVVQRWRAAWRAGAAVGTIPVGLFTRATLALPAREVQAARDQ